MSLLPENQLMWSSIVANSKMNRKRQASGINSYEQDFKFKPDAFIEQKLKENVKAAWLNLCCGEGNALIQAANYFRNKRLQQNITLTGIDLVDSFQSFDEKITCIHFKTGSVVEWIPDQSYDLISCCHGIHYLGDKIKVIKKALAVLNKDGLFISNLDLTDIMIDGNSAKIFLINNFKKNGLDYNNRTKILKRSGPAEIDFDLLYLGADDTCGPNYSGQDAVSSHYSMK